MHQQSQGSSNAGQWEVGLTRWSRFWLPCVFGPSSCYYMPARLGTWHRQAIISRVHHFESPNQTDLVTWLRLSHFVAEKVRRANKQQHQLFQFLMRPVDSDHYYPSGSNLFYQIILFQIYSFASIETHSPFSTPYKCTVTDYSSSFPILTIN